MVLWVAGRLQLAQGNRPRAEELWKQLDELAERTNVATVVVYLTQLDLIKAIVDGHLEEALTLSEWPAQTSLVRRCAGAYSMSRCCSADALPGSRSGVAATV